MDESNSRGSENSDPCVFDEQTTRTDRLANWMNE